MDLFSVDFITRDSCGSWNPLWLYVYKYSRLSLFVTFILIPTIVLIPVNKAHTPFTLWKLRGIRIKFWGCLFVFMTGIGHLLDGHLSFIFPAYHLFAAWHALTALVSWVTFFHFAYYKIDAASGMFAGFEHETYYEKRELEDDRRTQR